MILAYRSKRGDQSVHFFRIARDDLWAFPEYREGLLKQSRARMADLVFETWDVEVEVLKEKPADLDDRGWEALLRLNADQAD